MKRLLWHTFWLGALVVAAAVGLMHQADGYADAFYLRFTQPPQKSLILGTSRPAQGLQPSVMNKELPGAELFNFSFTIGHSPWGPTYLEGIKTRLREESDDGIFVLSVDPWSISSDSEDPNDLSTFGERGNFLTLDDMSSDPNYRYLLDHYARPWLYLAWDRQEVLRLHPNGWLEVSVPMDSASVADRTRGKLRTYREMNLPAYRFSRTRLEYLARTVRYLQGRGEVYLVRLPVHPGMMAIDRRQMPDFNERMEALSDSLGAPYLDLTPSNADYRYTDGNHLWKESGAEVSRRLARWIKAQD